LSFIEETSTLKLEYGAKNTDTNQICTGIEDLSSQSDAHATNADEALAAVSPDAARPEVFSDAEAHQADAQAFSSNGSIDQWDNYEFHGPQSFNLPMLSCEPSQEVLFPVATRRLASALRRFQSSVAPTIDLGTEPGLNDSLLFIGAKDCWLMNAILGICDAQVHPTASGSPDQGPARTSAKVINSGGAESILADSFTSFSTQIPRALLLVVFDLY
jgi:hypothetical protein